jgi:hypothetical protein
VESRAIAERRTLERCSPNLDSQLQTITPWSSATRKLSSEDTTKSLVSRVNQELKRCSRLYAELSLTAVANQRARLVVQVDAGPQFIFSKLPGVVPKTSTHNPTDTYLTSPHQRRSHSQRGEIFSLAAGTSSNRSESPSRLRGPDGFGDPPRHC